VFTFAEVDIKLYFRYVLNPYLKELTELRLGISSFLNLTFMDNGKFCPLEFENPALQGYFTHSLRNYFVSIIYKSA
jgi:hypothetical protein